MGTRHIQITLAPTRRGVTCNPNFTLTSRETRAMTGPRQARHTKAIDRSATGRIVEQQHVTTAWGGGGGGALV